MCTAWACDLECSPTLLSGPSVLDTASEVLLAASKLLASLVGVEVGDTFARVLGVVTGTVAVVVVGFTGDPVVWLSVSPEMENWTL